MKSDLQQVLALLPKLTSAERESVRAALGAMNAFGIASAAPSAAGVAQATALDRICDAVQAALAANEVPTTRTHLMHNLHKGSATEAAEQVMQWAQRQFPRSRIQQQQLLALGFALLYDDVVSFNGAHTAGRALISRMIEVPAIIDQHFPGYARAGMLGLALRPANHEV